MRKGRCLLAALLPASALADGGPRLSPLGVPYSDTVTLHCQSGRSILFFSPNTQSVRLLYRGKVSGWLGYLSFTSGIRYSNVGLPGMGEFDTPRLGEGLEWRSLAKSGFSWSKSELYRVTQHANGQRDLNLLERCSG
ncbi:hypothetical protein E5F05_12135 [Deinococcus metallilatus]|uniref:Uncharacterized protein n=1 Tax=Deinococcus metallilatus TaxID=1211322 RepID=A0AAE6D590_9DEIO|nr:hypothetical protein [Deinococcus metallilatus]MBB5295215.1 hypothetical protein [Deinococcus metallilatus]QBY08622.1 hypothetical protein E5F05_12135 [Deinococcus metallilatus]RXJ10501.1 hypothetical protein ERJ73_10965 [Deinococcus metallilatus]TLK26472.1 hypothetical protein FCS05_10715 [Deinococcus metallilatus]